MSIAYAPLALEKSLVLQKLHPEETASSISLDKPSTSTLVDEELLIDPNRDPSNQTDRVANERIGSPSSSTLDAKRGQVLFFPRPLDEPREYFNALQKWEGYVIEVGEETFLARLVPVRGEGVDQEAEIYLEEVDEEDRALVEPGAVFYWSIGYLDGPSGRRRVSAIRFRRLPAWVRYELDAAYAEVARLRELLGVEQSIRSTSTR